MELVVAVDGDVGCPPIAPPTPRVLGQQPLEARGLGPLERAGALARLMVRARGVGDVGSEAVDRGPARARPSEGRFAAATTPPRPALTRVSRACLREAARAGGWIRVSEGRADRKEDLVTVELAARRSRGRASDANLSDSAAGDAVGAAPLQAHRFEDRAFGRSW